MLCNPSVGTHPRGRAQGKEGYPQGIRERLAGKGLSFVEMVSTCNSGWKMSPVDANKWMEENLVPFYPLGDIKG